MLDISKEREVLNQYDDWKNGGKKRKRKTKEELSGCDERNSGRKMDGCANKKDEEQRRVAFHGCPRADGYGTAVR